jgi:hypothetical protein
MILKLYYQLSPCSKKSIKKRRYGKTYTPSHRLVTRLAKENNISKDEVVNTLYKEREHILKYPEYFY